MRKVEGAAYFSTKPVEPYLDLLPPTLRPLSGFSCDGYFNSQFDWEHGYGHGRLAYAIYTTNDNSVLTDDERKDQLQLLFAKAGIEVDFVP
jgi:hypothetical protein